MTASPENIASIIQDTLLPGTQLSAESPLFEHGLDSMAIMQFTVLCEESFGVMLEPTDLSRNNFETPASIAELVKSRASA